MKKTYKTLEDAFAQQLVASKRSNGGQSPDFDEVCRLAKELWAAEEESRHA